jgi:hypothetical protein
LFHENDVFVPDGTPVFVPRIWNGPLRKGRPRNWTVIGVPCGSETLTVSDVLEPMPVEPSDGATSAGAAGGPTATDPKPGTQLGLPTTVPVKPLPELSARVAPEPSLYPHRPRSPAVGAVSCVSLALWICACVRATFQIRDSSMIPAKCPATELSDRIAVPSAACWMLSDRGGIGVVVLTASEPSAAPSRYSLSVRPSYVTAAWCQTFWVTTVLPVSGWLIPGRGPVAPSSKSATSRPLVPWIPRK